MRILFAIPGLHRYDRGAEIAFLSLAEELTRLGETVTVMGSGADRPLASYRFLHASSLQREIFESFPSFPLFRNECSYEEASFIPDMLRKYRPADFDVTVTCGYPFTNWTLRRPVWGGARPAHVFVTQNGDWPAFSDKSEYRFFGCEGLVCTNPDFYERNKHRWLSELIPNGVDIDRFTKGSAQKPEFNLPADQLIILMVSALIPSKRVQVGIEAVSKIPDAHLVIAGDGPSRREIYALAAELLPDRFTTLSVPSHKMPTLYHSADVFLHLSREESFGNVFLEAMASGLPIVGYDSPRLRWIVGENEYLISTDYEIVTKIQQARNSPNLKKRIRVQRAVAFSWKEVGKQYQAFLGRVVKEYRRSAPRFLSSNH
jgi:glycosyltransferase involved in cell wall biosynthesis